MPVSLTHATHICEVCRKEFLAKWPKHKRCQDCVATGGKDWRHSKQRKVKQNQQQGTTQ